MKTALRLHFLAALASLALLTSTAAGIASCLQASGSQSTSTAASVKKAPAKGAPSAQEIADAKLKGLVWVNTSTHVYHKDASSLYGATKRGKFMNEEDAKKAGFRAANESGAMKKNATSSAGTQK